MIFTPDPLYYPGGTIERDDGSGVGEMRDVGPLYDKSILKEVRAKSMRCTELSPFDSSPNFTKIASVDTNVFAHRASMSNFKSVMFCFGGGGVYLKASSIMLRSVMLSILLSQVLKVQNEVINLDATFDNGTVTLSDICFKPLDPANKNCAIQSPLQFFQNKEENLDKEADWFDGCQFEENYLDQIYSCAV